MTPDNWEKVKDLFGQALDLPVEERPAFLNSLGDVDPTISRELSALLEEHERPGEFLPDLPVQAPPLDDLSGRTVGPYRLDRLIGFGGMSAVYLAERTDGAFSKQVAVKFLAAPFPQAPQRFHREREFLARLDHPNITRLLDGGSTMDFRILSSTMSRVCRSIVIAPSTVYPSAAGWLCCCRFATGSHTRIKT